MTSERWALIERIFHELPTVGTASREEVLQRCRGDEVLAGEVLALVHAGYREREQQLFYSDKTATDLLGRRIGAYEIDRLLGRGGMGAVYLARRADGEFDQRVAIKVIGLPWDSPFFRERLRLERQILAHLEHPYIARLLDGGVTPEGMLYLVVEYVEGMPLDQYCRERGLAVEARIRLFAKVCEAVHYAHQHLVIHCDLKPANILVDSHGIPRLLDFGTARLLSSESSQSLTSAALMTIRYASPEQLAGGRVSTATDIYSLGVVLYELLAGVHPFAGRTQAMLSADRTAPKPSSAADSRKIAKQLSGDLDSIVAMAMEPEPARRYGSVEQLAQDLNRQIEGQPVIARASTWRYRTGRFLRRNPRSSALTGALVLALAGLLAYSSRQTREARAEAEKANRLSRFLQDVLSYPNSRLGAPNQDLTYAGVLQSALRQADSTLAPDPEISAVVRHTLAHGYQHLGRNEDAADFFHQALALMRSVPRPDSYVLAHLYYDVGEEAKQQGKYAEAEGYLQRALTMAHPAGSPETAPDQVAMLESLALLRFTRGDSPDGLDPLFSRAGDLIRRFFGTGSVEEARLLMERARTRLVFGTPAEVRADLDRALEIVRQRPQALLTQVRNTLLLRCIGERMAGNISAARTFCEQSLAAADHSADHSGGVVGMIPVEIARIDALDGRPEAALPVLTKFVEATSQQGEPWEKSYGLTALGEALSLAGRHAEAEPVLRRALAIRRSAFPPGHPWTLETAGELGAVLMASNRCSDATSLIQEADRGFRSLLPPDHPHRRLSAERIRLLHQRCGR